MIAEHHLPTDFQFPDDPSHMWKVDVIQFVDFIKAQQKSHLADIFKFHHWLNDSGDLEEPVEVTENDKDSLSEPEQWRQHGRTQNGRGQAASRSKSVDPSRQVTEDRTRKS